MENRNLGDLLDFVEGVSAFSNELGEAAQALPGVRGAYRQFCRIAAGTPGQALFDLVDLPNVCSPYLADDGRTFGGAGEPPFFGGQCPELYDLFADATVRRDGVVTANNIVVGTGTGPIRFEVVDIPQPEGRTRLEGRYISQEGVMAHYVVRGTVPLAGGGEQVTETEISNFSLTRNDGGPDNCGDPDAPFQPGEGYQGEDYGLPVVYTDPSGRDWNVNVRTPTVRPDGGLSIPVSIDGFDLDIGLPGGGDVPGEGSPVFGPTSSGSPIGGNGGEGEVGLPEGPAGSKCIALALITSGFTGARGAVVNTAPNTRLFSVFGNLAVKVQADSGETYWSGDRTLTEERVIEPIPAEGLQIVSFRVNLETGLTYQAIPLYRADT